MDMVNKIWDWFGGKKSLDKIPLEELSRERLQLEQMENRVTRDVDNLEYKKRYLFDQGKGESSQRKQVILARKIKELDLEVQAKDRQLALISRQLRILTGIITLRENEKMMHDLGINGVVANLDMSELQAYVDQATVEGQFQLEKFAQMMRGLDSGDLLEQGALDEPDTLAIVQAMQEARDADLSDPQASKLHTESGLKQVESMLRKVDGEEEQDKTGLPA